jgi:hypothetical protein
MENNFVVAVGNIFVPGYLFIYLEISLRKFCLIL